MILVLGWLLAATAAQPLPPLEVGDVLLQQSRSAQAAAVAEATGSPWTHAAVVWEVGDEPRVIEAVQPVRLTELDAFVDRGEVIVLRPRRELTVSEVESLRARGAELLGRPYDAAFAWGDDRLYCSELVHELFLAATGIELGERRAVRSFHLSSPRVQQGLAERGIPLDRRVLAPSTLLEDDDLVRVSP